jgi:DNA-binding GntR family transcriptional regulator
LVEKQGLGRQTARRAFQELAAGGAVYRSAWSRNIPAKRPTPGTGRACRISEHLEQWSGM